MSGSTLPPETRRILRLARDDRARAREALRALPLEEQVALVCEAPAARRAELVELCPQPELLVPSLPPVELVVTVKALGVEDASWLLEHASDEQIVACVDLDAWRGFAPEPTALDLWLQVLASAGDDTLLRGFFALDRELVVLWLMERVEVFLKPNDEGWQPPAGAKTLDGQFYLRALRGGDDLEAALELLALLFESDYWTYFQVLQGVNWEVRSDLEEWALRWRTGRMQDLGFPPREEALAVYARLDADEARRLEDEAPLVESRSFALPVWMPGLPGDARSRHALFRAVAELGESERRACFHAFVALVNRVAVAERLPLSDAESIPKAIEKAASVASVGLEFLAGEHGLAPPDVLRRVSLERLFRVGVQRTGLVVAPADEGEAGADREAD
jgi:hypothetical protein